MDLELQDNQGVPFKLSNYQINDFLLLIFFRGAWCNHCKKQLQEIERYKAEFDQQHTKLLAISCDTNFHSSLLKSFLKLSFPVISDKDFAIIDKFNLKTIYKDQTISKPAIFLFSPEQKILFQYIGEEYDDRLSAKTILENIRPYTK
jgi:peroxiredoxin